jgi:uncharacterized protein (TIGR02271 family)
MFSSDEARALTGATAYDQAGHKVGTVADLYLDQATGQPQWLTIRTGLFGLRESFVPLALARARGQAEVQLATGKDIITAAPAIDPDGWLSAAEEQQLYRHYGLGYPGWGTLAGLPQAPGPAAAGAPAAPGHDPGPAAGETMTRSEERMRVGTATEETGRVRLRKYVVTETVTTQVPVSHEEVRLEREPITDASTGPAPDAPAIGEEEHEVVLHAERPVVAIEAVPIERVRLVTEQVTGEQTVSGVVRKEQIDTGTDGGADLPG